MLLYRGRFRVGLLLLLFALLQIPFLSGCSFFVLEEARGVRDTANANESTLKVLEVSRNAEIIHTCIELFNSKNQKKEIYTLVSPRWNYVTDDDLVRKESIRSYKVSEYLRDCKPLEYAVPLLEFADGDVVDLGFGMSEAIYFFQDKKGWALGYLAQDEYGQIFQNFGFDLSDLPVLDYYHSQKPYVLLLLPVTIPLDMAGIVVGGGAMIVTGIIVYPFLVIRCAGGDGSC